MDVVIPKRPTKEAANSSLIEPSQKEEVICRIFETTGSCPTRNCPNKAGHTPTKTAKEKYLQNLLRKFLQDKDTGIPILSDNSAATAFCKPCDKEQDTPSTSEKKQAAPETTTSLPKDRPNRSPNSTNKNPTQDPEPTHQATIDFDDPDFTPLLQDLEDETIRIENKGNSTTASSDAVKTQNRLNLGFLNMLSSMQSLQHSSSSSKESNQGYNSWPEASKKAFSHLWTEDPAIPAADAPDRIKKMLKLTNGAKIALHIKSMNNHMNWSVDAAQCKHMKIGDIAMNSFVKSSSGSQVKGISPFSCATDDNLDSSSKLSRLNMCHDTSQMMSDKDVNAMSYQKKFTPGEHMCLLNVLDNFVKLVETWMTEISWVFHVIHNFNEDIKRKQHAINNCITLHGKDFTFSLLSIIHTRFAILIDNLLTNPTSVTKQSLILSDLTSAIEQHTFMNNFKSIALINTNRPPPSRNEEERKTKRSFVRDQDPPSDIAKRNRIENPDKDDIKTDLRFRAISRVRAKVQNAGHKIPTVQGVELCLKWHLLGSCHSGCDRKDTHVKLTTGKVNQTKEYLKKCKEFINNDSGQ